jgi:hypothetical protein
MFHHSTNTALFLSVLIATLIFSLSLAGIAAAQDNTSLGTGALFSNTTARTTAPADSMRSLITPSATSTPPSGSRRSLATPQAPTTPPLGPEPMCLVGI